MILSKFDEISPTTQLIADVEILCSTYNLANFYYSMIFRLRNLLSSEVSSTPRIVESYFSALGNIKINQIQLLIIFMSKIHRVAIP